MLAVMSPPELIFIQGDSLPHLKQDRACRATPTQHFNDPLARTENQAPTPAQQSPSRPDLAAGPIRPRLSFRTAPEPVRGLSESRTRVARKQYTPCPDPHNPPSPARA